MNSFDLLFEGVFLIIVALFNLFFGIVYIWEAIKAPNKYISLGALDYLAIQLPIYAAIAAYFTQIFGTPIPHFIHLIIGFSFIPFTLIIWLYLFTRIYPKRNYLIILPTLALVFLFEGCFWYYLFTDISMLAVPEISFHMLYGPILIIFLLIYLCYYAITGYFFTKDSDLKEHNSDLVATGWLMVLINSIAIANYFILSVYFGSNIFLILPFGIMSSVYGMYHLARIRISKGVWKGLKEELKRGPL